MRESAFVIVAEPHRRAILGLLLSAERSVGEIEHALRLSQPSVSKHLRVLRDGGFVESRVEAQRRLYRLRPEPLMELDEWLAPFRQFWSRHLDALERHLDSMDDPRTASRTRQRAGARKRKAARASKHSSSTSPSSPSSPRTQRGKKPHG